ncbi:MAG TPA: MYXO-CTERM sorting domain-containing protein, partial [Polyangia bacterium]|nr:MYXO-CTERM sorting domain-containing protein [Polyangia bacterium]
NATGLAQIGQATLTSRYNDVFGNATANYQDATAGTGDLAVAVTFRSNADFHLVGFQPTTDKGDPSDGYALEPQPNGARVNMGAFGNTAAAELSQSVSGWTPVADARTGVAGAAAGASPVTDPAGSSHETPGGATTTPPGGGGSGCAVAGRGPTTSSFWLLFAVGALVIARRRR